MIVIPEGFWRGFILGTVGFLCGYIGPLYYYPSANLGPALGIFVTGPVSCFLGFAFDRLARKFRVNAWLRESSFILLVIAVAKVSLALSHPGPQLEGFLLDATVTACESSRTGEFFGPKPQRGGSGGMREGVVLTLSVSRRRPFYRTEGDLTPESWKAKPWSETKFVTQYFADYAGTDCNSYGQAGTTYWTAPGLLRVAPSAKGHEVPYPIEILGTVPPELPR